jgi:plastocyanin
VSLTAERPRPPTTLAPAEPRGDRLVGGALLLVATLLVGLQLLAGHVIPPLATFGAITLVLGAVTLRRRPRWLLIIDAVAALFYLAGSAPFLAANLVHPESPGSFLPEVFVLLGFLTVIGGVVLRLHGAGDLTRRRVVSGALGVAGVATVVSFVAAASVDAEARQHGDVAVVSDRSAFPVEVEVTSAEAVLWLDNRDPFHHTFVIDDADVRAVMPANRSARVPIDLAPGTYRFWCDVPGHESMEGALHVR